jgi:hypothetical protein
MSGKVNFTHNEATMAAAHVMALGVNSMC